MAGQRYIRLKEIPPSTSRSQEPSHSYRDFVDDTLEAGPFLCRSDSEGFIITGNETNNSDECLVFLGDSFVESIFNHEQSRFVSAVERLLAKSEHPRRCLNGGYSGSTSLQLVNLLLNKIYPLLSSAGTVFLFVPQSDVKLLDNPATYWNTTDLYTPIVPPVVPESTVLKRGMENTRKVLEIAISMARTLGVDLVLVTSPFRSAPQGQDDWLTLRLRGDSYERLLGWRQDFVRTVHDVARDNAVPLIDAAAYMRDRPDCFYDELHLNSKGQDVFATWLARAVTDHIADPPRSPAGVGKTQFLALALLLAGPRGKVSTSE